MFQEDYSSVTTESEANVGQTTEIYLSLYVTYQKLGAAFYDTASAILYYIGDIEETNRFDITQQILADVQPSVVICSAKCGEDYFNALQEHMNTTSQTG
ncbi:unnamed protein product [Didymodactylos carnosus]|uniref:Uncharacterized protein n=1 Tax=Didymodactylos carnosus TaxID=1234261 RepID=A0A8S2K9V1_9BILA|nr:unnamed protein product [Didymodactylos carnosus]CAF3841378.1 unnamed protein product [Didymodactylos carnosus]